MDKLGEAISNGKLSDVEEFFRNEDINTTDTVIFICIGNF